MPTSRERLYETGILTTMWLHHPVVSVGNLTLGGTGKTPLVIALAEGLRERGFRPVILSRGYGRTSRGIQIVGPQSSQWEQWGDEPFLMRQRLRNVPVIVGANRYEAGMVAEKKTVCRSRGTACRMRSMSSRNPMFNITSASSRIAISTPTGILMSSWTCWREGSSIEP